MTFHTRMPLKIYYLMLLICRNVVVLGFNVDTKNINVIHGPKGTHFGFSASFLPVREDSDMLRMIVGAPNGNTSESGQNSGVLRVCNNVLDINEKCSTTHHLNNFYMGGQTMNEEFGSSLAMTDSGNFMVCSPNWKDTRINYFTFLPGRCTLVDLNDTSASRFFQPFFANPLRDHKYVIEIDQRPEYVYGVASFGFSADSDRKSIFVFGSPGVLMSEGTVTIMNVMTNKVSTAGSAWTNKLSSTAYGYLGYAVKIGRFCDGSDVCFAASAPNRNRVGMVLIYRWVNEDELEIKQMFTERKAWSYFGYALCAVDVNNDGYDELLVGAPYFAMGDSPQDYDQGGVFIYSRTETNERLAQKNFVLDGAQERFAHFGTAIQSIGDINLDTYNDVAIGAPGENEGAGCIYIYLGGQTGLANSPSQRITAKQVSTGLSEPIQGFGFAFSDHIIPSKEKYPVFVATSVVNDTIVVFKSRHIVDVVASLTADPNPVNMDKACAETGASGACFKINLCMKYTLRGGGSLPLTFQVGLDMDVQVRSHLKRAMVRLQNGTLVDSHPEYQSQISVSNKDECKNFLAVLRENQVNQDRSTPVEILAKYILIEQPTSNMDPILDAVKPNNVSLSVTFLNKCGADNQCEVDLNIAGHLKYSHTGNPQSIVVSSTKELQVQIAVKNSNETSYWTAVKVDIDSPVPYSRFTSDVPVNCQADQSASDNTKTTVLCNYFKPLDQNASFSLYVLFDTEQIELTKKTVTIKAEALTKNLNSRELLPQDNIVTMTTVVDIIADVSVEGSSSPSEIAIYEARQISLKDAGSQNNFRPTGNEVKPLNVTHKVLVRNKGPSFLPNTTIIVHVPMFLVDRTKLIDDVDVKIATPDGRVTQCHGTIKFDYQQQTTPSTSFIPSSTAANTNSGKENITISTTRDPLDIGSSPNRRKKRATDDEGKNQNTIYTLDCDSDKDICQRFVCVTGTNIPSGSHAEINVSLTIDKANIPMPESHNAFYYSIHTQVDQPNHDLFVKWNSVRFVKTVTKFHLLQSGGKINIWIIIGSIIAGLVLITIIVLVFWKLGFFKRDKHHQVEQWRRESKRQSRKGYSKAPTDDAGEGSAPTDKES